VKYGQKPLYRHTGLRGSTPQVGFELGTPQPVSQSGDRLASVKETFTFQQSNRHVKSTRVYKDS